MNTHKKLNQGEINTLNTHSAGDSEAANQIWS